MLKVNTENVGETCVIACEGKLVRNDGALMLREAVLSQGGSHTIVIDLSKVDDIEGGGLGTLWALQKWAAEYNIQFKLFNPRSVVKHKLEHNEWTRFEIASLREIMALTALSEGADDDAGYSKAA
jgi:anti-anti-sigma regulatory factor